MDKEFFLKYSSPETPDSLSLAQAQNLLKDLASLEPETVKSDLPTDFPITFDLIQIYLTFRKTECCSLIWPFLLQILTLKQMNNSNEPEKFDLEIKAGDCLIENSSKLKLDLNFSLGEKEKDSFGEENFIGFKLNLSCENGELAKPKVETVLSNIKTLIKNFAKSIFQFYDLFEIKVEAKEKEVVLKFIMKDTTLPLILVKTLNFIQKAHQKTNGHPIQGSFYSKLELSCEGHATKPVFGGKYIDLNVGVTFPRILKEVLNKMLYEEAEKLMLQKESFGAKYIDRVSYFCLLQLGNFSLEFAKVEGLSEAIWKKKQLPLGEFLEENLTDMLRDGPPFLRKCIEALSLFSGNCSLKLISPVKTLDFELNLLIPEVLALFLKDLLSRKLK